MRKVVSIFFLIFFEVLGQKNCFYINESSYCIANNGIEKYNSDGVKTGNISLAGLNSIIGIDNDFQNNLWIFAQNGIAKLSQDSIYFLGFEDGLLNKEILSALIDQENTLWVGTSKGVYASSLQDEIFLKRNAVFESDSIINIFENRNGVYVNNANHATQNVKKYDQNNIYIFIFSLIVIIGFSVLFFILFHNKKNQKKLELVEIEKQMLLHQMSPHFMFNALNSIKSHLLKASEKESTAIFIQKYAILMRMYLESSRSKTISIENEITCLENYLELEQLRTQHKFDYEIELIPKNAGKEEILPFFIQPIIENAIWHGIMPSENRGLLKITMEIKPSFVKITMQDNGVGRSFEKQKNSSKYGGKAMKIIEERIKIEKNEFKNSPIKMEIVDLVDGTLVTLHLPIYLS
jgi:hypothetical protein